jgi:hypothetical protein
MRTASLLAIQLDPHCTQCFKILVVSVIALLESALHQQLLSFCSAAVPPKFASSIWNSLSCSSLYLFLV